MAFFLIVPSVIIVSIFLVHAIAERLNFKIKYSSLILCSIMSFAINFAAIELSTYLDRWHYIRLGILIFIASIIVTAYNKILIGKEKDVIIVPSQQDETDEQIELTKTDDNVSISNVKHIDIKLTDKTIESKTSESISDKINKIDKTTKTDNKIPVVKSDEKNEIKQSAKPVADKKQIDNSNLNKPDKVNTIDKSKVKPIIKTTVEKADNVNSADKSTLKPITKTTVEKTDKVNTVSKPAIKPIEKTVDKPSAPMSISEKFKNDSSIEKKIASPATIKVINEPAEEKPAPKKIEVVDEIDSHLGSLDDILDYAYAEKASGNLRQAISAYQRALERYKNDDYAPFIAIDLGNIYKEQAAYTKVIKTYEDALKLPVVIRNSATYSEFSKNLAYMRMIQTILLRHRALSTPFSKIPAQYLQEVETELKAAQMRTKYK